MATTRRKSPATSSKRRATSDSASPPQIHPNPAFRPDPDRALFITGPFNQDLVYRITPDIVRFQHQSRAPISVYIDSPGGKVTQMRSVLRLLHLPGLDSPDACRVITIVTSLAASAAATLLCSGDYVMAFPGSIIHFHGVRTYRETEITKEEADNVARDLRATNDAHAVALARARSQQFFFRSIALRSEFVEHRKAHPELTDETDDIDCLIGLLSERLSTWGMEVIRKAEVRYKRYKSLSAQVFRSPRVRKQLTLIRTDPKKGDYAKAEAEMLKVITAFEVPRSKKAGWTFATDGIQMVNDDFMLLNEYIGQCNNTWIETFCAAWKDFLLSDVDKQEIELLPEDQRKPAQVERVSRILLPLWLFFGSICHVLQESENPLTPEDAFWLGLVDEVVGANLPTLRRVVERTPPIRTKL